MCLVNGKEREWENVKDSLFPLDEAKGGKKDDKGESDHDYGTSESNDDQDDE